MNEPQLIDTPKQKVANISEIIKFCELYSLEPLIVCCASELKKHPVTSWSELMDHASDMTSVFVYSVGKLLTFPGHSAHEHPYAYAFGTAEAIFCMVANMFPVPLLQTAALILPTITTIATWIFVDGETAATILVGATSVKICIECAQEIIFTGGTLFKFTEFGIA